MIILIDNYDSFTYNLLDYFLQIGLNCRVFRNDDCPINKIVKMEPQALIFSPGPQTPEKGGNMMNLIKKFHSQIPILGICLGHQAIGEFFGAKLVRAKRPMHGKTSLITHSDKIFNKFPDKIEVMRYHSLILSEIDKTPLKIIAKTHDGEIMGIVHHQLPVYGFQFHPESILTGNGIQLLKNWSKINKLTN